MSLRLLVDEDTQDASLVLMLRVEGHDVLTVNEAGLRSRPDAVVLARAVADGRVVLTRNVDDFRALHRDAPTHAGIIAICEERDSSKNLTGPQVVRAIANVEASGWELAGQFVVLNAWSFEPPVSRS